MVNWLSTSPSSGNGYNTISVTALPNTGGTRNTTVMVNGNQTNVAVSVEQKNGPYELMPMTFKIASAGTINWYHRRTLFDDVGYLTIQYRINEGQWTSLTATSAGTSFNVSAGDVVEFKGDNVRYGSLPLSYTTFSGSTAVFEAYGNTMSLIDSVNYPTVENLTEQYAFNRLFASCTGLTSAENLIMPTTVIPMHVYTSMFEGCTSLTTSPLLPGIAPNNSAYNEMFKGCTSLNDVRCLATDVSNYRCTYNWLSGVSQTGTFTKAASMTGWGTGNDGIPSGWTVIDYFDNSWIHFGQTAGTGNTIISVSADPNISESIRTSYFTVSGNTKSVTVPVTQDGFNVDDYFTVVVKTATTGISPDNIFHIEFTGGTYVSYSLNGGDWVTNETSTNNPWTVIYNLKAGDVIRLKSNGHGCYDRCITTTGLTYALMGNIMSLVYGDNFRGKTSYPYPSLHTTWGQFTNPASAVTDVSRLFLPATSATISYTGMFTGCVNIKEPPIMSDTTITYGSGNLFGGVCEDMFAGCRSLRRTPEMTITLSNAPRACASMFEGCTSLTTNRITLNTMSLSGCDGCYALMFNRCISLTKAPELPATTLSYGCYDAMFADCKSLTIPPALPASTLAARCYFGMFEGCSGLLSAPTLPAITLPEHCYYYMFAGCSALTMPPVLQATSLGEFCYGCMFLDCTGLSSAPLLPATTLSNGCYSGMFTGCTNLNYIKCLATDHSAFHATAEWVKGVASSGTFVKASSATWDTGIDGIPNNWTIQNA